MSAKTSSKDAAAHAPACGPRATRVHQLAIALLGVALLLLLRAVGILCNKEDATSITHALSTMAASWWVRHPWSAASTRTALSYEHSEDIFRHFGQYSPWFPAGKAQYTTPPDSCEVDQVSLLIRHGARFPTRSITPFLRATVDKLAAAKLSQEAASRFSWLNEYRYDLGQENLVPLGVSQCVPASDPLSSFHRTRAPTDASSTDLRLQTIATQESRRGHRSVPQVLPPRGQGYLFAQL